MNGTIDNQQVTQTEAAWLAGIWDGEGSFGTCYANKNTSKNFGIRISVVNSDATILKKITDILDKADIGYHVQEKGYGAFPGSHKQVWAIRIGKYKQGAMALDLMMPYLSGKLSRAQLLKKFINSRLSRIQKVSRNSDCPYSKEELELLANICDLNGNQRGTSETIRAEIANRGL